MDTGPQRYLLRRRRPTPPFLRTARLHAVGFAALVGVCLAAGVVTAFALPTTGRPRASRAVLGPVVVLVGLVVADRHRWGRLETGFSFSDDDAELRRVGSRLIAQGLPVRVDEQEWGPRLRYRNRDARRVHAALSELGVVTPEPPARR